MWTTYTDEEREDIMGKLRNRDPMAKDLRQPKYRPRVVESKRKKPPRKRKHKGKPE